MSPQRWSVSVDIPDLRDLLTNKLIRLDHRIQDARTKTVRDLFWGLALKERPWPRFLEPVGVTIDHEYAGTGKLPDPSGAVLVAKAALDGLVLAGVLADDDSSRVLWERHKAATRGPLSRLTLTLEVPDP